MNRALTKNLLREIKGSFGRFIAIFAIMALGSGFFAGLRVTKDALVEMGDRYMTQQQFFDYRLVSTLGLTDEDVTAFARLDGVKSVSGSVTQDALFENENGAQSVIRIHTLTENINTPYLTAGRMPEAANECLLDAGSADASAIGTILTVSENNDKDLLEDLAQQKFTVVGLMQSPYYLNQQRGTTSLGTGTVDCYIYVQPVAFDMDYFTEIFLTLEGTEGKKIYSADYNDAAAAMETPLTDLLEERAEIRYQDIVSDATEEYNDGVAEYEKEKADAEQKLRDGYYDLVQAENDIVAAQKELDDAKATLEDSETQLADTKTEMESGQKELEDAKSQLVDSRTQLDAGWEQYEQAVAIYGEAAMAQTKAQLEHSEAEYAAAEAIVLENETALQEALDKIAAAEAEIADGWAEYEDGLTDLEDGRREVNQGWNDYFEGKKEAEQEFADAEAELADAWADIQEIRRATTYVLGRDTNIGYTSFDCDTSIMTSIAKVFPFLFFLIAALVCITTMTRMVEENRTLIGTLKALGYGKGAIAAEFLLYSGVASLSGSIIGFLLGSYLLPEIIWSIYSVMYDLTDITFFFDGGLFAATVLGYFVCAMAATWYVCYHELTEVPAILMRPKPPKPGKRILLERIGVLWNRLGFLQKVALRNVVQYKQRMLMMVLGIGGCTALLVTGFGLYDSIADVVDHQYGQICTYDYLVSFNDPLTEEREAAFQAEFGDDLESYIITSTQAMDLTFHDATKSVNTVIPAENSLDGFIDLRYDGASVPFPGVGEIVICENLAATMGIAVGDTVTVVDEELRQMELTVSGIMENYVMNYMFIAPETFTEQLGEAPEMNSMLVNVAEGKDLYQVSANILTSDDISNVTLSQDNADSIGGSLSSMIYIVYVVIFCSGALAFIVLYNLTNININERIREIATIKVLGFYPRETTSYVTRESLILTGMGALAGLFAGKLLHLYVMTQVKVEAMYFPVIIKPMSYVYAVILTFVFAFLINAIMSLRLRKINMAESLKSIE